MSRTARTLVIDDDILVARMVGLRLASKFPGMRVDATTDPKILSNYDIYLIDNDFNGVPLGTALARRIRNEHPDSLVIALSSTLDAEILKDLLNAGCHGACDKGSDEDFETLIALIRRFLDTRRAGDESGRGFLGVLRSMTELLRHWNRRLDRLETR
jgi:DNA-binding NarL/FixJ family response regulator